MSNLSQFFALGGGNKIKKIQTVTAQQTNTGNQWTWSGVSASISAVDTSKTLLICSPSSNGAVYWTRDSATDTTVGGGLVHTGHGAYLHSSTQIRFHGNPVTQTTFNLNLSVAYMVVQVVEFE